MARDRHLAGRAAAPRQRTSTDHGWPVSMLATVGRCRAGCCVATVKPPDAGRSTLMPTLGPAVRMDSLAGIGRQQNLVRTIAEAIVAAAAGRSLRVAVGWSNPDEVGFADQLTQALLARGLPCRRLSRKASPTGAD